MRAYLRAARRLSFSLLAPVHTILPLAKMSAVVLGSRMRMMTAAKRCVRVEGVCVQGVCVCVCCVVLGGGGGGESAGAF